MSASAMPTVWLHLAVSADGSSIVCRMDYGPVVEWLRPRLRGVWP